MSTIETIHLEAPGDHGLRASFAPDANLVLHSLTLDGRELLATRKGLQAYVESGSTMGVPLLHPWANRLAGLSYTVAGTEVELDPSSGLFRRDPGGHPIHGALPALMRWEVIRADSASLLARLDWDRAHPAFELFPFAHRLEYRASLEAAAVQIEVSLDPTEDVAVPVSFGFHPYLRIPGGPRERAELTLPPARVLVLDDSLMPTGESEPLEPGPRPLGETAWDDGLSGLDNPARFELRGGDAALSLTFLRGYPFGQVFAPPGSDFVSFEPMTAPANALARGGSGLAVVGPGDRYETAFEIAVRSPTGARGR